MIVAPCPFCKSACDTTRSVAFDVVMSYRVRCLECCYLSPISRFESEAITAHNALCARLSAAAAMAEALEPLAREADNWLPGAPDNKWIGHSKVIGSVLSEYIPITVGHARAAQRALAAWKAAQNSQPAPGAEDTGNV